MDYHGTVGDTGSLRSPFRVCVCVYMCGPLCMCRAPPGWEEPLLAGESSSRLGRAPPGWGEPLLHSSWLALSAKSSDQVTEISGILSSASAFRSLFVPGDFAPAG